MREDKSLVIFHANCTDGFTAAWIAARALKTCELHAAQYSTAPPDVAGRTVYILDFSYERPVMVHLATQAERLVVLDHHQTAQADLAGLETEHHSVTCCFDMQHSGAALAWAWFHPFEEPPWLVWYVEDRDLWRWALPQSRLVSAGIEAVDHKLPSWDALAQRTPEALATDGEVIERYRQLCIGAACELARLVCMAGEWVPAANTSEMRFASDTAYALADGFPFAATYWLRADNVVQFSLRSRPDGADVSTIAKRFGGGGHLHAAGFETSITVLMELLRESRSMQ